MLTQHSDPTAGRPTDASSQWVTELNRLGKARIPCFFLLDFELRKPLIFVDTDGMQGPVRFNWPAQPGGSESGGQHTLRASPLPYNRFLDAFNVVQGGLQRGDSFLANLTFSTPVTSNGSLTEIYTATQAKYRVLLPDEFVCFSPETFVTISGDGVIATSPMKGTAPDTPEGIAELLRSPKEIAEHATVVDLLRNDLSRVARQVRVTDYRYLQHVETREGGLVQTSSRIAGELGGGWQERMGTILAELLPAGSVSGAPKSATLDLIRRAEGQDRGYYCGIGGYFDGTALDTCVLIRFVERVGEQLYFRSGGGITAYSDPKSEYDEMIRKIRLPLKENR